MGYLDNTGLAYLWGKIKAKLVQPDWQQNDETAPDYVKNRPGGYDAPEVNITWNGNTTGKEITQSDENFFVRVSARTPSKSELLGGTLVFVDRRYAEEEVETISIDESQMTDIDGALLLSELVFIVYNPPVNFDSYSFTEAGVWFAGKEKVDAPDSAVFFASLLRGSVTPVKIPKKYLELDNTLGITSATVGQIAQITAVDDSGRPTAWEAADVESNNIVLASSTTGSTKKFRLTVDDSGTLGAVEVTDAS